MTAITPGHLGGPAAAVEEALPPAGPGGGGAQPALAAVVAVVDGGMAPGQTGIIRSYAGDGSIYTGALNNGSLSRCKIGAALIYAKQTALVGASLIVKFWQTFI